MSCGMNGQKKKWFSFGKKKDDDEDLKIQDVKFIFKYNYF